MGAAENLDRESGTYVASREPPHDDVAESCVVGAMLVAESSPLTDELLAMVPADAYYDPKKRAVHEAIAWLRENRRAVDVTAVQARLVDERKDRAVGGVDALTSMVNAMPTATAENVRGYARRVLDQWEIRKALVLCQRYEQQILQRKCGEAKELKERLETDIFELCQGAELGGPERINEIAMREIRSHEAGAREEVIPTGFPTYDRLVRGGLRRKNFTIIAGQTSMGKTAWALNMAHRVALSGHGVLFISLEMTKEELFQRMACSQGDVSSTRIDEARARMCSLSDRERKAYVDAMTSLAFLPFYVVDEPGQTIASVRAHGRRAIADMARTTTRSGAPRQPCRLGLIVVDYLQLMKPTATKKDRNREQEVADVSRNCKGLAKYLDCHVAALSQLNEDAAKRKDNDRRPKLGDLRESKAMAHDADLVTFVWRGDYELERDARGKTIEDVCDAEIIIAKQRGGRSGGAAKMTFLKSRQRFESVEDQGEWGSA